MMTRVLTSIVALGLVVGTLGSAEAKQPARSERTVQGSYGPYPAPVTGCNEPLGTFACMVVTTRPRERSFTAKVTDVHGQPVFVEVMQRGYVLATFCGETARPLAIPPGTTSLEFHLGLNNWAPTVDCPTSRVKTTGTISVTLSNLR